MRTFSEISITPQPVFTDPPWAAVRRLPNDSEKQALRVEEACEAIHSQGKERWRRRWQLGEKGQHLRELVPSPSQATCKLHARRPKPESAILTQLRTGKVGFNAFLYDKRVPGVWSRRCACGQGAMTVQHVLLVCPSWRDIRQEIGLVRQDIRWALTTREGASLAIQFILRTGLLEQFRLHAGETQGLRIQTADEVENEGDEVEEDMEEEVEEEEGRERE